MRTYSTETVRDILTTAITLSPPATFEQAQSLLTLAVNSMKANRPQSHQDLSRLYEMVQILDAIYAVSRRDVEAKDAVTA